MGRRRRGGALICIAAAAAAAAVIWFFSALNGLQIGHGEEGRQQLEDALRRAAVLCYAAEGVYPPSLDYIREHYGVETEQEDYLIFYEVFAENLMPDITVIEKEVK